MKSNFFIYKFLLILLIITLIIFFKSNSVFAYQELFSYKDVSYNWSIPDKAYDTMINLPEFNQGLYDIWANCMGGTLTVSFFPKSFNLKIWKTEANNGRYRSNCDSISNFEFFYYNIAERDGSITRNKTYTSFFSDSNGSFSYYISGYSHYFYTNMTLYLGPELSEVFYDGSEEGEGDFVLPSILNTDDELANLSFDNLIIKQGSFPQIRLVLYNYDDNSELLELNLYEDYSDYLQRIDLSNPFSSLGYVIPASALPKFSVKKGTKYNWAVFYSSVSQVDKIVTSNVSTVFNENSEQSPEDKRNEELKNAIEQSNKEVKESIDRQTEKIEEQTDAIKQNTETNKNIFEKIGEILSFLNPFSENFFAYKLIDLLVNALKSLFIPEDNFFSNYFNELNEWFSDRLGFLYYPLDLLFDLLNRFLNINFSEPVINIPEIKEPFTSVTLINPISFNFNTLLENETLNSVHDIYLLIVDAAIYIGLVILLYKKYEEVINK